MTRLADGVSIAVMAFNKGPVRHPIKITWDMLGLAPGVRYKVRDLWTHEDNKVPSTDDLVVLVPSHGVSMLKLTPL